MVYNLIPMSTSDTPRPDGEASNNPKLDPIFQFLEAVSQRYQKDLTNPADQPAGDLSSQLDKALKHLERSPWAERVSAELPYGIAMALGAWLVEGFADRYDADAPGERQGERREPRSVLESLLAAEPITVELGRNLVWLVTGEAPLLAKIGALRRYFARSFGLIVPGIRCRDNLELGGDDYLIMVDDLPVGSHHIHSRQLLSVGPQARLDEFGLVGTPDPVYGLPSAWIEPERRSDLESAGCLIVDPPSALMSHLTQVVRRHAHKLLGRQQVVYLLKLTERNHPALVREARRRLTPGLLRKILQNLLFEQLPIRRLPTILEAVLDEAEHSLDAEYLTETARRALGRQLVLEHESPAGVFNALQVTTELCDALREDFSGRRLRPDRSLNLRAALDEGLRTLTGQGLWPAVVIDPELRWAFKRWSYPFHPDLVVLGTDEVAPDVALEVLGTLGFPPEDEPAAEPPE